jgi:hypothetical protein
MYLNTFSSFLKHFSLGLESWNFQDNACGLNYNFYNVIIILLPFMIILVCGLQYLYVWLMIHFKSFGNQFGIGFLLSILIDMSPCSNDSSKLIFHLFYQTIYNFLYERIAFSSFVHTFISAHGWKFNVQSQTHPEAGNMSSISWKFYWVL